MNNTHITTLLFDLDDTLWDTMPTIHRAEAGLYAWLQEHAAAVTHAMTPEDMRLARMQLSKNQPDIAHNMTAIRHVSLQQAFARFGVSQDLVAPAVRVFRDLRNQVHVFDDVEAVLTDLKARGYTLVSLTNGNAEVPATPLADYFAHNINAEAVGHCKPHPAMFEQAIRSAGASVQETMHVGDDPMRDIAPAQALGMKTVWVNRHEQSWPDTLSEADYSVQDISGLPNILGLRY